MVLKNSLPKNFTRSAIAATILGTVGCQAAIADGHSENAVGTGFYISGFVGAAFTTDSDFSGIVTPPGGPQTAAVSFDTDVKFGGSLGVQLGSFAVEGFSPRIEAEVSYLSSDADTIDFTGNGPGNENNVGGDITRTLLMANALFDINTGTAITPYIGGGVGAAFTDVDIVYGGPVGAPPPIRFTQNDTNFAAQAIVGASFDLSENTAFFVDGRYTQIFNVNGARFNPAGLTGTIEDDVSDVSVNLGIRVSF